MRKHVQKSMLLPAAYLSVVVGCSEPMRVDLDDEAVVLELRGTVEENVPISGDHHSAAEVGDHATIRIGYVPRHLATDDTDEHTRYYTVHDPDVAWDYVELSVHGEVWRCMLSQLALQDQLSSGDRIFASGSSDNEDFDLLAAVQIVDTAEPFDLLSGVELPADATGFGTDLDYGGGSFLFGPPSDPDQQSLLQVSIETIEMRSN
jgi:hypothetical protein